MGWRSGFRMAAAGLLVGVSACAVNGPAGDGDAVGDDLSAEEGPLLPSLQATVTDDAVLFVLQITNTSAEPVELEFSSGQTYDFAVFDDGTEVWRWSADRFFTQALRSETIDAGETKAYEARWTPPAAASGEHRVVARLTSRSHPVEQETRLQLP